MSKLSARRYRRGHDMLILRVGVGGERAARSFRRFLKVCCLLVSVKGSLKVPMLRSFWTYGHSPRRPTPFHSLTHSRA